MTNSGVGTFLPDFKRNRLKSSGRAVNGLSLFFVDKFQKAPSEKAIQTSMAAIKAQGFPVSNSWDNWPTTWGMGFCVNQESGSVAYITSREMQEAGKYVLVQQNSHNIVKPIQQLIPSDELKDPFVKDILYAFGNGEIRAKIKDALHASLEPDLRKLESELPGLLSPGLKKGLLSKEDAIYHIPALMREDNVRVLLERILKESNVRRLDFSEDIKNNPDMLRKTLNNEVLHDASAEVRSGIAKIIVYNAVWRDESECFTSFLKQIIRGIKLEKPSFQFMQYLDKLLLVFGFHRWLIGYVRSLITPSKNPTEYYERYYKTLYKSCIQAGIDILELYRRYYGGFSNV